MTDRAAEQEAREIAEQLSHQGWLARLDYGEQIKHVVAVIAPHLQRRDDELARLRKGTPDGRDGADPFASVGASAREGDRTGHFSAEQRAEQMVNRYQDCFILYESSKLELKRTITDLIDQLDALKAQHEAALAEIKARDAALETGAATIKAQKAKLAERSIVDVAGDLICEAHPTQEWPHDDCAGPGMPMWNALGLLAEAQREIERLRDEKQAETVRANTYLNKIKALRERVWGLGEALDTLLGCFLVNPRTGELGLDATKAIASRVAEARAVLALGEGRGTE